MCRCSHTLATSTARFSMTRQGTHRSLLKASYRILKSIGERTRRHRSTDAALPTTLRSILPMLRACALSGFWVELIFPGEPILFRNGICSTGSSIATWSIKAKKDSKKGTHNETLECCTHCARRLGHALVLVDTSLRASTGLRCRHCCWLDN